MRARRVIDPADVRRLADAGLPARGIGEATGFHPNAIAHFARRNGIELPPGVSSKNCAFWVANHERMLRLREAGLSTAAVARIIGTTKNAVIGRLNRTRDHDTPPERGYPFPAAGRCVFPYSDPDKPDFRFCGAAADPGKPYCVSHCAVAYRRTSKPEEWIDAA